MGKGRDMVPREHFNKEPLARTILLTTPSAPLRNGAI
jgi:hypothetical protein